jgi:hypothetical protein
METKSWSIPILLVGVCAFIAAGAFFFIGHEAAIYAVLAMPVPVFLLFLGWNVETVEEKRIAAAQRWRASQQVVAAPKAPLRLDRAA